MTLNCLAQQIIQCKRLRSTLSKFDFTELVLHQYHYTKDWARGKVGIEVEQR
jgi:hypothetical protein